MSNVNTVKVVAMACVGLAGAPSALAQAGFTLAPDSPIRFLPQGWFGDVDSDNDGCPDLPIIPRIGQVSRDGGLFLNIDDDPELEFLHVGDLQSADDPFCTDGRPVPTPDTYFRGDAGIPNLVFYPNFGQSLFAWNHDGTPVPGWPVIVGGRNHFSTLAAGDVDGDGEDELVLTDNFFGIPPNNLFVLETSGEPGQSLQTPTFNGGVALQIGGVFKVPSLANLDDDPGLEILILEKFGTFAELSAIDNDGSLMPGFPIPLDTNRQTAPFAEERGSSGATVSVGDLDNDGSNEIVVASFTDLFIFNADGTQVAEFSTPSDPGAPLPNGVQGWEPPAFAGSPLVESNAPSFSSFNAVSLANMDDDDDLELVFVVNLNFQSFVPDGRPFPKPHIYVVNIDGTVAPGWPQEHVQPFLGPDGATNTNGQPLSVADVDGDGEYDVIFADSCFGDADPFTPGLQDCSVLNVWGADGTLKPGFPVVTAVNEGIPGNQNQIMVADIDNDGFMEMFTDNNRAANPNLVWNHDGTPAAGWDLVANYPTIDGSGVPGFADTNNDGFMDIVLPIANIAQNKIIVNGADEEDYIIGDSGSYYFFSSQSIPYSDDRAPVRTYGYNNQRTFVVPPLPEPPACIADWNSDGFVDDLDVDEFVADLGVQGAFTDLTGDGIYDAFDFFLFLDFVNAGCS